MTHVMRCVGLGVGCLSSFCGSFDSLVRRFASVSVLVDVRSRRFINREYTHENRGRPREILEWPCTKGGGGLTPCVTFRLVVVSLRSPGQSPVLPFACCAGSLLSVGRCGRCSCWCLYRVNNPPPPQTKVTIVGKRNLPLGKFGQAIFGTHTIGSPPPPPLF